VKLSRKQLLRAGASVAMAPLAAACSAPHAGAASDPRFHFDEDRFKAILAAPARHKQCCASAKIAGGAVLDAMVATMYAYQYDLGEGAGTVHEVAVLYHPAGVMLGLNDHVWNSMISPALPHLSEYFTSDLEAHRKAKPGGGNPYLHRHRGEALQDDISIEALVSRGCDFFVCNNALSGLAGALAKALGKQSARIHGELLANLVPGAMAVPAGVMAINACQEAHFTYLQASL
jgi:intracellular sulfur oxidation DsrE/DsrF family protein